MYGLTSRGSMQLALYLFVGVLLLIVLVGSSALIYNAFSISVAERSQYLGMLASVGATRQQKRRSVYFEGLVLGAVSIPIGLLAGIGGIGVTLHFVGPMIAQVADLTQEVRLVVSPASILAAVALSVLLFSYQCTSRPAWPRTRCQLMQSARRGKSGCGGKMCTPPGSPGNALVLRARSP